VKTPAAHQGVAEQVILVDPEDHDIGVADKLEAHRQGALHRAFSVFVFDAAGRVLLQQRAMTKYHSGGLWSNTCCGHPRPGEDVARAARRRLREEMGFECDLEPGGQFSYRAAVGDLIEHEYDHVFAGRFDGEPRPDAAEVAAWRWVDVPGLLLELASQPERHTAWLGFALNEVRTQGYPKPATR
jgi:isopentenyl-diphosphate delta-isomerase